MLFVSNYNNILKQYAKIKFYIIEFSGLKVRISIFQISVTHISDLYINFEFLFSFFNIDDLKILLKDLERFLHVEAVFVPIFPKPLLLVQQSNQTAFWWHKLDEPMIPNLIPMFFI